MFAALSMAETTELSAMTIRSSRRNFTDCPSLQSPFPRPLPPCSCMGSMEPRARAVDRTEGRDGPDGPGMAIWFAWARVQTAIFGFGRSLYGEPDISAYL